jgi:hypothetical protein
MRKYVICLSLFVLTASAINADELADTLAPQYFYMEACRDISPPLRPDRLRTIDALREIVDEAELKKAIMRVIVRWGRDKEKIASFCSQMATMIKNEEGYDATR